MYNWIGVTCIFLTIKTCVFPLETSNDYVKISIEHMHLKKSHICWLNTNLMYKAINESANFMDKQKFEDVWINANILIMLKDPGRKFNGVWP